MKKEKVMLQNITDRVKKYFIGEAAMHIVEMLQKNCVSDATRHLIKMDGYDNAYTALAHQLSFGPNESCEAILDDMDFAAKTQFAMLPNFVHNIMEYECANTEENRSHFCKSAFHKALTLISNDDNAANQEEDKKLLEAEIPF
ncbi:MAG: hypothetical protein IJG43_08350 [Acidaminococcaceae bacterium]|nr:hypothetical protein [Acidaminococcaceae bacterium]